MAGLPLPFSVGYRHLAATGSSPSPRQCKRVRFTHQWRGVHLQSRRIGQTIFPAQEEANSYGGCTGLRGFFRKGVLKVSHGFMEGRGIIYVSSPLSHTLRVCYLHRRPSRTWGFRVALCCDMTGRFVVDMRLLIQPWCLAL